MKISFDSDCLRDCCCEFDRGEAAFGTYIARIVFNMIADAEAAENCGEWHDFLVNDLVLCAADSFQVAVGTEYIASFVPAGRKYKADEDGQTTWSSVTRLKLTDIRRR